ncbi:hypothetical protein B0H34DRAFT_862872 [Crassisporium funariophilum]|nr:hypothetical protein B0H34DRAFT_862872 [Crassisporium funariophilum]
MDLPPHPNGPRKTLADFPKPPLYGHKSTEGRKVDLVMFGFPINQEYILDFAHHYNILPNAEEVDRIDNTFLHLAYTVRTVLNARLIALRDDEEYTRRSLDFTVVIASNRTQAHLDRMQYFERLAQFLLLNSNAATWVFPNKESALAAQRLEKDKNKIV